MMGVQSKVGDGPQIPTLFDIFSKEFLPSGSESGKDGESPFSRGTNFKPNNAGSTKLRTLSVTKERDRPDKKSTGSNSRGRRTFSEDSGTTDISPHGTLTGSGTDSQRMRLHNRAGSKLSTLFSSPFVKVDKLEQLNELLNSYTVNGLPAMPELLTFGQPQYEDQQFVLESHWTDVVDETEGLSKKEKDHQEAVWELLRTEVNYIKSVKVVLDLFMCCLINLQNESLLNEIDTDKLFSNISKIIAANCNFWCEYLLPMVTKARKTREPLDPVLMKEGFSKFEEIFHPYTRYCLDQEMCLEYIKSRLRDNDLFKTFVSWAETQRACGRLKLTDLIVKPWQRLTKYSLLLNAILKKSNSEQERSHLLVMIENVDRFVRNVNATMRQRQEQERVALIMNKIESYDPIDAPNEESVKIIQEFSTLDLNCPVPGCSPSQKRNLLLEGPLKLRDAYSKTDVYCFLLTDMFLVTKPSKRGDKLKVIKPPMRLDKIVIQELRDPGSFLLIYLNEFHLVSSAYVFQGEAKHWSRHFRKAQDAYKEARQSASERSESRLIFTDLYDETEEEYSTVGIFGPPPPYPQDTLNAADTSFAGSDHSRDSMLSVDRFIPSNMPRSVSNDTLIRMIVAEQQAAGNNEDYLGQRPRSATFSGNDHQRSESPVNKSSSLNDKLSQLGSATPSKISNGAMSPSRSPNCSRKVLSDKKRPPVPPKPGSKPNTPELVNYAFHTNNDHLMAMLGGDEYLQDLRGKLNQRRMSRTEKRYFTADAIQELQKDKDTSIHKRLSWSYGTVDINIDDRVGHLKGRVISSDSIRSVPSSSGVSSTGSLHHTEDSISSNDPQQSNYTDTDMQMIIISPDDDLGEPSSESSENHSNIGQSNNSCKTVRSTSSDNSKRDDQSGIVSSAKSNSKSLPDISQLHLSTSEVQDGIASVNIGKTEGQRRKLSHAQILRMKKQLLLNSTLEASEV